MNLKDIFYVVGIISAFIIGATNIYIALKNRRNSLRENIYKAQLNFISDLLKQFYLLHHDLTRLSSNKAINENPRDKIESIFKTSFSNMHLSSEQTLNQISETLNKSLDFINCKDSTEKEQKFQDYFRNFRSLISLLRKELGTDPLSTENQLLHKRTFI